jgi:hypothetical protein
MWKPVTLAAALLTAGCSEFPAAPETAGSSPAAVPGTSGGEALVVFQVPEDSPGPPYWTILANGGFVPTDGEWAALPFLRDYTVPGCIPSGQDLSVIVGPLAFGCPLTVEGHEHWQNGPGIDPAPRQTKFIGLGAVPIVFVELDELETTLAGGLTLAELLALPSAIVGHADRYNETDILGVSGPLGPGRGMYKIQARGELTDGRAFTLHVNEVLGELQKVRIYFGE